MRQENGNGPISLSQLQPKMPTVAKFFRENVESRCGYSRAGVCQEMTDNVLASLNQGEDDLNRRPILEQWPVGARHQRNPQISCRAS